MIKFKLFNLLLALMLLGGGAFAQTGAQSNKLDKNDEQLKSLVKQITDAQTQYDAPMLERILTADYIEISPAGELDERAKVLSFYTPEAKAKRATAPPLVEISDFSIRRRDESAVVIAKITYTINGADNKPARPPFSLRAMFVCRREKGAWKIVSTQYTGIRPPQTPPKSE